MNRLWHFAFGLLGVWLMVADTRRAERERAKRTLH